MKYFRNTVGIILYNTHLETVQASFFSRSTNNNPGGGGGDQNMDVDGNNDAFMQSPQAPEEVNQMETDNGNANQLATQQQNQVEQSNNGGGFSGMDFNQMMDLLNSGHSINLNANINETGQVTQTSVTAVKAEPGQTVTTWSDGRVDIQENNNNSSGSDSNKNENGADQPQQENQNPEQFVQQNNQIEQPMVEENGGNDSSGNLNFDQMNDLLNAGHNINYSTQTNESGAQQTMTAVQVESGQTVVTTINDGNVDIQQIDSTTEFLNPGNESKM